MKSIMNAWTFGGVRLESFGHVTELNSYLDMPPKRGGNVFVPMRDGQTFVSKYFDQKVISFGMEIVSDGVCDLEEKLDSLKILLGSRMQQYLSNPAFTTGERRALAEVTTPLGVTRSPDPRVARIVIDFLLAEPFMRSVAQYAPAATVIDAHNVSATIVNAGTAPERHAIITLTGPLEWGAGGITIYNTRNGVQLLYLADIAGGSYVTIDCGEFTAYDNAANNVIGNVSHVGDYHFMVFEPGDNILTLDEDNPSTGTVAVTFYPPYL
jgi:hypothetical protein